jgi:hypothetical protein
MLLGQLQLTQLTPTLRLANVFGQHGYGRVSGIQTDYRAVAESLNRLKVMLHDEKPQIYIPFRMGCGLGGGNWDEYSRLVEAYFPSAIVCKI